MRRRAILGGTAVAVTASAGAGWWLHDTPATPTDTGVPTGSATVQRTDLSTTTTVPGTLGYVGAYTVNWQGPPGGTVTWLPRPGRVISRGQTVFTVDNRPVRLLYGDRPAWRSLELGVTAGPDVRALEQNLVVLGHATTSTMTVDGRFTGATAAAVRRWQRATHQSVTGRVPLGDVTFQAGRLRVTTLGATAGGRVGGGPVVSGTSPTVAVTLAVPVTETHAVRLHDAVTVTLPGGDKVPGRVTELSTVATAPSERDLGRGSELPSVAAIVTLQRQVAGAALDQAPVEVDVVTESAKGVLAVPITALVALAEGGYAVYLLDGGARRLTGVTPGLFSQTLVQVAGAGLHEGSTVEVPAS
ncbi:peptidoglycan-binding protein [Actinoplanes sp. TBRC 11911]|uniref:peptidoglycan-binding domain-containing protein n=1 Tax=Actinoplanes sp. TBRC 11911 TaxID=2729386 RepID=UPI00145F8100|nr:peptidoglycan-binding domain-containing protein [Actinoplanes sp. TBRC 11911]NMO50004.1 peptidoglycan-binding protein [Actinoplanes sp. TBRC 11911]